MAWLWIRKRLSASRLTFRCNRNPGWELPGPRSSTAPPIGSTSKLASEISDTTCHSSPCASSDASAVNSMLLPLCCSSSPTRKLPAITPPMMTSANKARASAIPRSVRAEQSVLSILQRDLCSERLGQRTGRRVVVVCAAPADGYRDALYRAGNCRGHLSGIAVNQAKPVGCCQWPEHRLDGLARAE